jgi:multicomponent Na+:H+ antiporter subunit G
MSYASHIAGAVLIAIGLFFMLIAAVGFIRLPDLFSRLHVTGILDTLGAPLVLLGAAVWIGLSLTAGKLLLGIAFLYLTSPMVGHLLSRAAIESGYRPTVIDDESESGDFDVRRYQQTGPSTESTGEADA